MGDNSIGERIFKSLFYLPMLRKNLLLHYFVDSNFSSISFRFMQLNLYFLQIEFSTKHLTILMV